MTRTDNETTLTIYSIVENSKPFQNRLGKFFEKTHDISHMKFLLEHRKTCQKLAQEKSKMSPSGKS